MTEIPRTLDEAILAIDQMLAPKDQVWIRTVDEEKASGRLHFNFGMWIRNNWGLWTDSVLARWFDAKGITHADDMSGIIIASFWRWSNDRPLDLEGQIAKYQAHWGKQKS